MNYKQAIKEFKEIYSNELNKKPIDKSKINFLFNCFTDNLQKNKVITEKQKFNWLDPIQYQIEKKEKREQQKQQIQPEIQKIDISQAITNSNLGKYQKTIDWCNKKKGCDYFCGQRKQKTCEKLKQHHQEMEKISNLTN